MDIGDVRDDVTMPDTAVMNGRRAGVPLAPVVFDIAHLRRYTAGCRDLEREIIELYCTQAQIYLRDLAAAATQKDWHFAAHTIKGSALAIGAKRLADAAARAEHAPPGAHPAHVEELARANVELLSELARLQLA